MKFSASGVARRCRRVFASFAIETLVLLVAADARAFLPPERPALANFDKRTQTQPPPAALSAPSAASAEQLAAREQLRARLPGARVDFDPVTGAPKAISAGAGFLSGASATNDPYGPTKAFLREHRGLFGHGPEALDKARVKSKFVTPHNGLTTVVWEQQVDGVPLFEALLTSHTTKKGELVALSSQFVPDPERAADRGVTNRAAALAAPEVSAGRAVVIAARNVGEELEESGVRSQESGAGAKGTGYPASSDPEKRQQFKGTGLKGVAQAKLVWLPISNRQLRLCWEVVFTSRTRGEMFRVLVDSQTGQPWLRRCLTEYISDASYRVFTSDSPSPFSPGLQTPGSFQPPMVAATLVTQPALDTNASPAGWIDDGVNETIGNNVDAHTDWNADDLPDLPRPQGSPDRVFDFSMDLTTADPAEYSSAAVVQLFYWCNWMHDKLYALGFTEAAGNFQSNNFGRGGLDNDALQADAQDGSGFNNANMSTPSDGSPPRMQMFIFTGSSPRRDGDLDAEVVLHEFTHGLSNRRVGGGVGITALQSRGMGEGWSDFYALSLLSEASDDPDGDYAIGAYVSYQLGPGFDQNYYFGIRRYPYTTDLSKNPLTFKDIDPAQSSSHPSAPISTVVGGGGASEVHNQGEVWCVTLWDARANLIHKYGGTNGNRTMLQLVTDGMNLSPPNPTFLQARDAILQADLVDNAGVNRGELWAAFAKRGMGLSAGAPGSSTTTGVQEAFDLPDDLRITPASGFTSTGPVGGPFSSNSLTLTLTNAGTNSLTWNLTNTAGWLNLSPSGGTLVPGGAAAFVTANLNSSASNLPAGIYSASVWFTNLSSLTGQNRQFTLRIGQPDYFTESFDANDNDLAFSSFTFMPNSSGSFYAVCREAAGAFPTDPASGINVWLTDDSWAQVTLSGVNTISLYGKRTNVFFIGSNGYLTLDSGDATYVESMSAHFDRPRISALFHDLNPGMGGTISWKELADRVAVTYQNVPQYAAATPNSFQIEMFFDGRLRLTYLALNCLNNVAGLSAGAGVPAGFLESDFSAFAACPPTPPSLAWQPAGLQVKPGTNVSFSIIANGSSPLQFRWRKNGAALSDGGNIVGAATTTLKLSNVAESDSGQYSVLVTNAYGSVLSSNAALLVSALDHFAWAHIPSSQSVNVPFTVTVVAQDAANATVSNYNGSAGFSADSAAVAPPNSGGFALGHWTGSITITQAAASLVLQADDGFGHTGSSEAFQVVSAPMLAAETYGNLLLFHWTAGAPALRLESSSNLSTGWSPLSGPVQIGDQYVLPATTSEPRRFFRLHYTAP